MKLYRRTGSRLRTTWSRCGRAATFASAEDAVGRFVEAYPHAPHDPHLAEFRRGIGERSDAELTPDRSRTGGIDRNARVSGLASVPERPIEVRVLEFSVGGVRPKRLS